jgi:hypothetical protein
MGRMPRCRCARDFPCSLRTASTILHGEPARPGQNSPSGLALQIQGVSATARGFARSMWDPRQPGKIKTQAPQQLATTSKNTPQAKFKNPRAPDGFARLHPSRTMQKYFAPGSAGWHRLSAAVALPSCGGVHGRMSVRRSRRRQSAESTAGSSGCPNPCARKKLLRRAPRSDHVMNDASRAGGFCPPPEAKSIEYRLTTTCEPVTG